MLLGVSKDHRPTARRSPVGDHRGVTDQSVGVAKVKSSAPVSASQIRVVSSVLPVAIRLPSGDQLPFQTCPVCVLIVKSFSPVFASQMMTGLSFEPISSDPPVVSRSVPSGD